MNPAPAPPPLRVDPAGPDLSELHAVSEAGLEEDVPGHRLRCCSLSNSLLPLRQNELGLHPFIHFTHFLPF